MSREASERASVKERSPTHSLRVVFAVGSPLCLALLLYFAALAPRRPVGGEHPVLFPVVAAGLCLSELTSIKIRSRKLSLAIAPTEIPLAVAIVFLTPALALLAGGIGYVAAATFRRRSVVKIFTGLSAFLLAVSTSIWAYGSLIGRSATTTRGWLVAFIAVSVIMVVDFAVVLLIMWFTDPLWRRPPLKPLLVQISACIAVGTAGGLVAISLISVNIWGVLLFAAMLVGTSWAYRATVMAGQRYANLEKLYDFTRRLSTLTEGHDVMVTVLEEARTLLTASRAELVIPLDPPLDGVALRCTLVDEEPAHFEEGVPVPELGQMVGERGAVLLARGSEDAALRRAMRNHGVREALVAPLQREDRKAGYLLVADRPFKHDGFSPSDLLFFETLAVNAGVALRSSELLEKLRREVSVRQHQAYHDGLTGLPNRVLFNERLEESLIEGTKTGDKVAVLLIDLDGFKDVNDTLGHDTGDAILREIAHRLTPFVGQKSLVARLGGDEFAILLGAARNERSIEAAATQVLNVITRPMGIENLLLDIRASVGVAVAPALGRGRDAVNLVRHADIAMYSAKETGGGIRFYDPAEDRSTLRRLTLATELRRAMERESLEVFYQPVVHLGTGEVLSCEALLRWSHDQFGPISPVEFIPVAESAGLIDPLTWWVLERALGQLKRWHEMVPGMSVSVNLSARSLTDRRVTDRVVRALELSGLDARWLTLEVTESSMMADPAVSQQAMYDLKEMGIKLSIDDYGTGFSSLSRLKDLPFRELKIDRSFIKEMIRDQGDEAIVRSTIDLARNLGRTVTAEGVEDKATLHRLASFGCHAAQGFYLARPLPAPDCTNWLSSFVRWPSTVGAPKLADLSKPGAGEGGDDWGSTAWQLNP